MKKVEVPGKDVLAPVLFDFSYKINGHQQEGYESSRYNLVIATKQFDSVTFKECGHRKKDNQYECVDYTGPAGNSIVQFGE